MQDDAHNGKKGESHRVPDRISRCQVIWQEGPTCAVPVAVMFRSAADRPYVTTLDVLKGSLGCRYPLPVCKHIRSWMLRFSPQSSYREH